MVTVQRYHGATSCIFPVGKVSDKAQHLCDVTLEALEAAIAQCGPDVPVRRIRVDVKATGAEAYLGPRVGPPVSHSNIRPAKSLLAAATVLKM